MTVNITARVVGQEQLDAMFDEMRKRGGNFVPVWWKIDKRMNVFLRKQFETSGGQVAGGKWKPLLPATQRARVESMRLWGARGGRNLGGIDHPLWDTGRMMESFEKFGQESLRVLKPFSYERGSIVPYAYYHQEGDGVPQRQIIPDPFPKYIVRSWLRLIESHLLNTVALPEPAPEG